MTTVRGGREGIHPTVYYTWPKDFMKAGKERMRGDTVRGADSPSRIRGRVAGPRNGGTGLERPWITVIQGHARQLTKRRPWL